MTTMETPDRIVGQRKQKVTLGEAFAEFWRHPSPWMIAATLVGLAYEWTHYLVHTDYKPRGRLYKAVWRHHRLHHFKNEHYWMTVTTAHTADRLFGTDPDPATVATSRTAKNLHGLA